MLWIIWIRLLAKLLQHVKHRVLIKDRRLRGHLGVQKHYRATWMILTIQLCYVSHRNDWPVLIFKVIKGVHYQSWKYTTQTPGCPLKTGSTRHISPFHRILFHITTNQNLAHFSHFEPLNFPAPNEHTSTFQCPIGADITSQQTIDSPLTAKFP